MQVLIINTVYSLSVILHLLLIVCANVVTKWLYQNVIFKISIMLFYLKHRAMPYHCVVGLGIWWLEGNKEGWVYKIVNG